MRTGLKYRTSSGEDVLRSTAESVTASLLFAVFVCIVGASCMTSELSDKEKRDLKDIDKFNAEIGRSGWHIEGKLLKELDISRIELNKSSLRNVELERVICRNGRISKSRFQKAKFVSGDFSNSAFTEVEFTDCEFGGVSFQKAVFHNCTFKNCRADRIKIEDGVFRECSLEDFADDSGIYTRTQFLKTNILKPDWRNTSLYHTKFDSTEIASGKMELTVFGNSDISKLTMTEMEIIGGSFGESTIRELTLNQCRSRGISFGKASIDKLRFVACDGLSGLSVTNSDCRQIEFEKCMKLSEPKFFISRIDSLVIAECDVAYLYCVESEFISGSVIRGSNIAGANFESAKVTGLKIENSQLSDYLVVSNATFRNLSLNDVTYAEGIEIDSLNVVYVESDSFRSE